VAFDARDCVWRAPDVRSRKVRCSGVISGAEEISLALGAGGSGAPDEFAANPVSAIATKTIDDWYRIYVFRCLPDGGIQRRAVVESDEVYCRVRNLHLFDDRKVIILRQYTAILCAVCCCSSAGG
jgi:hypothetical protein